MGSITLTNSRTCLGRRRVAVAAAGLLLIAGCGGGGGGSGAAAEGTAVIQLTDVPFASLTSLTLSITRVELYSVQGDAFQVFPPASDPAAALTVDLVALGDGRRLLAASAVRSGSYSGVRILYSGATGDAGGVAQTVTPSSGTIRVDFAEEVLVRAGEPASILLDFDGAASVTSGGAASVTLTPAVFHLLGEASAALEDLEGVVGAIESGGFTIDADDADRAAGETVVALGDLAVGVGAGTLFQVDGSLFQGLAGLDRLAAGDVVEVCGRLGPEGLAASLVKVERPGASNPIRVRGNLSALSPARTLLLARIERDEDGDLVGASPGDTLTFTLDSGTSYSRLVGSGALSQSDLFVGQAVELTGVLTAGEVGTAALELRETELSGTLTAIDLPGDGDPETDDDDVEDEDENTAAITVTAVDGAAVGSFPGLGSVTLDLAGASAVVGGAIPYHVPFLDVGQEVKARGYFTAADEFAVTRLSLEEAEDIAATFLELDGVPGTFLVTAGGEIRRVHLHEGTRLAVRRLGEGGRIVNLTRGEFLGELDDALGSISIRGLQTGTDIDAIRAQFDRP